MWGPTRGPNIECAICTIKNYGEKKSNPQAKPTHPALLQPTGQAWQVTRVENFFRVENINPPCQNLQVMQVNLANPTLFAISTLMWVGVSSASLFLIPTISFLQSSSFIFTISSLFPFSHSLQVPKQIIIIAKGCCG